MISIPVAFSGNLGFNFLATFTGDDIIKDEMAQQYKAMLNQPQVDTGKRKLSTGKTIKKLFNKFVA